MDNLENPVTYRSSEQRNSGQICARKMCRVVSCHGRCAKLAKSLGPLSPAAIRHVNGRLLAEVLFHAKVTVAPNDCIRFGTVGCGDLAEIVIR